MMDINTLRSLGIEDSTTQQGLLQFFAGCSLLAGDDRRGQMEVFTCCIKQKLSELEAFGSQGTDHDKQFSKSNSELESVIAEKKSIEARLKSCLDKEITKREALELSLACKEVQEDSTQTPWNCYVEIQIPENGISNTEHIITYTSQNQDDGEEGYCPLIKCQNNTAEFKEQNQKNGSNTKQVKLKRRKRHFELLLFAMYSRIFVPCMVLRKIDVAITKMLESSRLLKPRRKASRTRQIAKHKPLLRTRMLAP
jgi:hypothetical protein